MSEKKNIKPKRVAKKKINYEEEPRYTHKLVREEINNDNNNDDKRSY